MTTDKKGIAFVGNILVDIVKNVDHYPLCGTLVNIRGLSMSVGGCVPNTAIDLATIDPSVPLCAIGMVGKDDYGQFVCKKMADKGIDTSGIVFSDTISTSFTDVMNIPSGERTFFHMRGANADFAPEMVDLDKLSCDILHAGYILLLDKFDAPDSTYGTAMARFLHDAQARGIKTSIDAVSDSSANYQEKVLPALRYCDYAIMNEVEACAIWGLEPYIGDTIQPDVVRKAMENMARAGVKEKVIIHSKPMGFCLDVPSGAFTQVPSLRIPSEAILGSVGAGDAFCAGSLYGIYTGMNDREILEFASAAAACNLFAENSVDGMQNLAGIREVMAKYPRQ